MDDLEAVLSLETFDLQPKPVSSSGTCLACAITQFIWGCLHSISPLPPQDLIGLEKDFENSLAGTSSIPCASTAAVADVTARLEDEDTTGKG
jgi:hypothetical protein